MDRERLYHLYKSVLCHYGAIPDSEEEFNALIGKLLDIYQQKNKDVDELYF